VPPREGGSPREGTGQAKAAHCTAHKAQHTGTPATLGFARYHICLCSAHLHFRALDRLRDPPSELQFRPPTSTVTWSQQQAPAARQQARQQARQLQQQGRPDMCAGGVMHLKFGSEDPKRSTHMDMIVTEALLRRSPTFFRQIHLNFSSHRAITVNEGAPSSAENDFKWFLIVSTATDTRKAVAVRRSDDAVPPDSTTRFFGQPLQCSASGCCYCYILRLFRLTIRTIGRLTEMLAAKQGRLQAPMHCHDCKVLVWSF
jgi:hypothetical protein